MNNIEQKYQRYAEITALIKGLEAEQDAISAELFADLEKQEGNQFKSDFGTFYYKSTKKWVYPEYVKEAEVAYKTEKKKAEESGEATFEETKSLSFRAK